MPNIISASIPGGRIESLSSNSAQPRGPTIPTSTTTLPEVHHTHKGHESAVPFEFSSMLATDVVHMNDDSSPGVNDAVAEALAQECDTAMAAIDQAGSVASTNNEERPSCLIVEPIVDPRDGPTPMARYLAEQPREEGSVLPHYVALGP